MFLLLITAGCEQPPPPKKPPPPPVVVSQKMPAKKPTAPTKAEPAAVHAEKKTMAPPNQESTTQPVPEDLVKREQAETAAAESAKRSIKSGVAGGTVTETATAQGAVTESAATEGAKAGKTDAAETGAVNAGAAVASGLEDAGKKQDAYTPTDPLDPFMPLVQQEQSQEGAVDDAEKPKRLLTPLEKMELSQIKLVAVVVMQDRTIAMVEEASGKGYEVRVGTYMGRNSGQVSEIRPSSIVVKEYVKDYRGKRKQRFQEIKLQKRDYGE